MSGTYPRLKEGPVTFQVNATVKGGQLVEPDGTTGRVKPTAGASSTVLGVALTDAEPTSNAAPTDPVTMVWPPADVAVARGCDIKLTYSGAAAFGELIKSAAGGQVAALGAGTFDQAIGRCTEPGGVSGAGATGRTRLF